MSIDRVRPQRRRLRALSSALALALLATGCDTAPDVVEEAVASGPSVEDDPQGALQRAVAALGDWEGLEAELRLDADAEARTEAMAEGEVTADEVALLLGSSIELRAAGLDEQGNAAVETAVVVDGSSVFDLQVSSDERLFLRVDLETLSSLSDDAEPGDLDDLVAEARMLGLGEVAQAAADGRWVEIIGIDDVMELAEAEATDRSDEPEVDEEELDALDSRVATAFERFVDEDLAVGYVGSDDAGEQVRVTTDGASLEALLDELATEVDRTGLLEDAGPGGLDDLDVDPDTVVSIDAWIQGGELRRLAIDLGALDEADELPGELLLTITLEEFTGTITEPDDAEPFDVLALAGAFLGGTGDEPFGELGDLEGSGDAVSGDLGGDEPVGGSDTDSLVGGDGEPRCIGEEELELVEQFGSSEELDQLEELFETGVLERC
jgi:hypothetical protein